MRNRANWALTTVRQLRNVLRLITMSAVEEGRDVTTIDPDGTKQVFSDCTGLSGIVVIPPSTDGYPTGWW